MGKVIKRDVEKLQEAGILGGLEGGSRLKKRCVPARNEPLRDSSNVTLYLRGSHARGTRL